MDYFIAINGVQQGPFLIGDLVGRGMRRDTLVWRAGMPQWQRADSIPELAALLATAPPPSSSPPPPPYPMPSASQGQSAPQGSPMLQPILVGESNRIVVGVIGIVLGGLGIHKFILGMNKQGLIMLLCSILSLGLLAPVMHIIGLIEGIIYLTKSDQEFYQTYVVGKKPWF